MSLWLIALFLIPSFAFLPFPCLLPIAFIIFSAFYTLSYKALIFHLRRYSRRPEHSRDNAPSNHSIQGCSTKYINNSA